MVFDWGFRCFSDIEGNITNKSIYAFSFLTGKHREPQSINAKLFLPIIPIGIVAYALTLLWDNLCRNSCISLPHVHTPWFERIITWPELLELPPHCADIHCIENLFIQIKCNLEDEAIKQTILLNSHLNSLQNEFHEHSAISLLRKWTNSY